MSHQNFVDQDFIKTLLEQESSPQVVYPWVLKETLFLSAPQMWRCLTLTRRVSSCTWRHSSRCFPKAFPWKPSRRWRRCRGRPRPASPGWRQRSTTKSRPSSASPNRWDAQTHMLFQSSLPSLSLLLRLPCDTIMAHWFCFFSNFLWKMARLVWTSFQPDLMSLCPQKLFFFEEKAHHCGSH